MFIRKNVLLKNYSGYKIGGPADFFCEPKSKKELLTALNFSLKKNIPVYMLGGGFNILISDSGFRGLIIKPKINYLAVKKNGMIAGAGVDLGRAIKFSLKNGLLGLEEFSGIPGTIGGALYINIHYYQALLNNFVEWIECVDNKLNSYLIKAKNENWKYEFSQIQKSGLIVVRACFKLKKVNQEQKWKAIGKAEEIIRTRFYKYPQEPSAGSVFQNIDSKNFYGAPSISAAHYIDRLGMKGTRVGGAEISGRHANMIINKGGATAKDVIKLASLIKKRVKNKFGIEFKPEVQFIGFKSDPF
ncbi:MAG: UDP-N-acetylmuramate dehydrogenase [Candidatus Paceibacterota bacterium]|jgi:UDP-N-acetylmuramate dehydrogenase